MLLKKDFYIRENVVQIAKELLGKILVTKVNGKITAGIITETEAYNGIYDKACHAYNGKVTERNKIMYAEGGVSYVYLCYGMHYLFNVVTNQKNIPDAVLIRGIMPYKGEKYIFERISPQSLKNGILNGPGKVTKALKIDKSFYGESLIHSKKIWIEDEGIQISENKINIGKRIGIDYAEEDALLPYRFWVDREI